MNQTPESVPFVPWAEFKRDVFRWEQGQHLSIIAPTGVGKSVLMRHLQADRSFVVVVGIKPRDKTLDDLTKPKFGKFRETLEIPRDAGAKYPRILLWPKLRHARDHQWQAHVIETAIHKCWEQTNWCIAVDEVGYLCKTLKLTWLCEQLWEQGRSLGISFLAATQRPRHVPLTMFSSASHLFLGGTNDVEDLKRLGGLNGADTALVKAVLQRLQSKLTHEILYVNAQTGSLCITKSPL